MVYLMNSKPDAPWRNGTSAAILDGASRQQRLVLEARAQSDIAPRSRDRLISTNGARGDTAAQRHLWAARRGGNLRQTKLLRDRGRFQTVADEKGDVIRAWSATRGEDALETFAIRERSQFTQSETYTVASQAGPTKSCGTPRQGRTEHAGIDQQRRIRHHIANDGAQRRHAGRLSAREKERFPDMTAKGAYCRKNQGPTRSERAMTGDCREEGRGGARTANTPP